MNASFGSHVTRSVSPRLVPSLQRRVALPARFLGNALSLLVLLVFGAVSASLRAQTANFAGAVTALAGAPTTTEPTGMAFDASGNLYMVEAQNNTVWEMTYTFGNYNAAVQLVSASTFVHLSQIAVDPSGNVWIADEGTTTTHGQVYEIVNTGGTLATTATAIGAGWTTPTGITVDTAGNIYVTDGTANTLSEITGSNGGGWTATTINTALNSPYGIAIDPATGTMFLANASHIDTLASPYTTVTPLNQLAAPVGTLVGVSLDSKANLWIADFGGNQVWEYTAASGYVTGLQWGTGFSEPVIALPDNNGNIFVSNYNGGPFDEIATAGVNLGSAATGGGSTATIPVVFNFTGASTTINAPIVVTQGSAGLDFADAGGDTCTTAGNPYVAGTSCTVFVQMNPRASGQRFGGVELQNGSGQTIAYAYLYGSGRGPQMTFNAGQTPNPESSAFNAPSGITVDANGDVYVANTGASQILKQTGGAGAFASIGSGLNSPEGVAVDGLGNVFIADTGNGQVVEISNGTQTTLGGSFSAPTALAVDQYGNVFVADGGSNNNIDEITAASGYSTVRTLLHTSTAPLGVAVDTFGNLFIVSTGSTSVTWLQAVNGVIPASPTSLTIGTFTSASAVAADGVGNLYVLDAGTIYEYGFLGASPYYNSTPTETVISGLTSPAGIAVDGKGNVYYTNAGADNKTYQVDLADGPTLTFNSTAYLATSTDSPKTVAINNIGGGAGSTLAISGLAVTTTTAGAANSFTDTGSTCTSSTNLAQGTTCDLSLSFTPQAAATTPIVGTAVTTDNNLNGTGVTQTINLSGPVTKATGTVVAANATATYNTAAQNVTLTATVTATGVPQVNEGTVAFTVLGTTGGTVTSPTVVSGAASVTYPIPAGQAGGTYTIQAVYTDASGNITTSTDTTHTLSIGLAAQAALTVNVTSPATYNTTQTLTTTGGSGTGAVTYSVGASTACSVTGATLTITAGTGTCSVTATKAADTNYSAITSAAATVTVQKASQAALTVNATSPAAYNSTQTLTTTGGSGTGAVTYSVGASTACSVTGTTLTITAGTGTCSVTATKAADNNYNAVTSAAATVTVQLATQSALTVNVTSPATYNTTQTLTTTGGSGTGAVTYSAGASTACSVTGTTLTITAGTGTCSVTATKAADTNYSALTSAATTVTVAPANLTIVVNSASRVYGAANPTFSGTVTGILNGDAVTVTYSSTATASSPVGTYPITATISGAKAGNYNPVVTAGTLTVTKAGLTIVVNSATRAYNTANPAFSGAVTGLVGGDVLNTTVIVAYSSTATTTSPVGTYPITATVSGSSSGNYTPTVTNGVLTITQATPTIAWTAPAAITYGTALSSTQLDASSTVAGTFTYTPAAGTILPAGANQTLSVSFTPTDTTDYKNNTATTTITVTAGTLTLAANSATRVYGTANPTFTGTVTGALNGDTFTESFATTATTASNVGTYAIVPSATGSNLADYTVVTTNGTLTITKANSTTALTTSGTTVNPGDTVTLTATVASATSGTPTGTVSFYDGTTLLGTGTLSGGVASYSTTTLAAGVAHTITAVYGGDINFNGSNTTTSTGITVGVLDFTLGTPTPASQSGNAGTAFTYSFGITPTYGTYAGTVNFTATGLPAGALATFSPASIPANGGPQTVTMILSTVSQSAALVKPSIAGRGLIPIALAFLFLPLAGTKRMRREGRRLGRLACMLLLVLAGLGATAALTGCGSHAGITGSGQSYTVTITATSGSIQHTTTVTLDLQ